MPLPTLADLKDKGIKKPRVQDAKIETTRARPTKEKIETDIDERDFEVNTVEERQERKKLLDILLKENKDIDIEELIRTEVMGNNMATKKGTTTRTGQPLKRVREGMEDVFTTLQLRELIEDFRKKKTENTDSQEANNTSDNKMAYMMPFLQKMQNGGTNAGGLDPNMLYLLMANQGNKGGNDLNQLLMLMMMMNAGSQNQHDAQGNPIYQGGVNSNNMTMLMNEIKNIMDKQEQKPQIDPTMMLVLQMMNKQVSSQPQQNTMKDIATLITALNSQNSNKPQDTQLPMVMEMMRQNWALQNERVMNMMPNEAPEDRIIRSANLIRELQGDARQRTESEMDFALRKQQMVLDEQQRLDMLDREERAQNREDAKSDRTLGMVSTVMDKVIGEGLGQLVGDLVSARGKGDKSARGANEPENFDASILDEFD